MDEKPESFLTRPWKGKSGLLAWFIVLASTIFVAAMALSSGTDSNRQMLTIALVCSISIPVLGFLVIGFIRWLCCWRNLKRFIFGIASLVTLVALFYAEENWRGKRAWENYKREWEAKGEKFDLVSLVPKPVPDEQNFAMTPLLKPIYEYDHGTNGVRWRDTNAFGHLMNIRADLAHPGNVKSELPLGNLERGTFADLEACRNFYRGNTNYPQPVKPGTAAEDILVALGKFDAEVKELREAAVAHSYSRFPIEYDNEMPQSILLPHLATIKMLSILLQLRTVARLEAGQTGEAFADLKLGFRLSDSIRDEPILIDHLIRMAALAMNLQSVREGLVRHVWNDEQLAQLEEYLLSVDLLAESNQAIRGERFFSVASLDYFRRQGFNLKSGELYGGFDGEGSLSYVGVPNFMPSGWFYQNMLTIARLHQDNTLAIVDSKTHRVSPDVSANQDRVLMNMRATPYTIFAKFLFPAIAKLSAKSARAQTYVDATRVACALERYRLANGQFPDALDTLTPRFIDKIPNDVIDGKPLRYHRTPDGGYLIYSIGWNKTDDGGVATLPKDEAIDWGMKRGPVDPEKGDWVWQIPAR